MFTYAPSSTRRPAVYMTRRDFAELSGRANALEHTAVGQSLQAELMRAIMAPDGSTRSFVRLGSKVAYEDLESGAIRRLTLCLPEDASLDDMRLSVLTPVGAALIGATAGQVLEYVVGGGPARRLRILEVKNEQ
ncbi:MAG: GreA/GreB family elongation factor [Phenylobacterium sp.]|uniref:GreA/GreB family elongation factor n=1 Tax=Phenylobacterium sp. TaxID=1871053 RepID=UPI0027333885|nr:GreA/GreB family elongation factor [Phenylobacterium sp.]MDP3173345.1 GreA/GreB family elongation factor [Phenylobacterium sp.]